MQAGTASAEPCPPEIEVEVEEHEDGEEADEDVEGADAGGSDSASAKKQRKNKSTRWNIPKSALQTLEQMFERDKFPSVETRKKLAQELNVTPRQVQVWFQNKRQRSVKPPATRNAPQGDRNYLSTSDEIKAALMNLCSTGHVDPTRPQQDVMLEDSIRSLESSPAAASRSIDSAQHMPTMSQPPKGAQQPPKQPKQPPGTAQQSQKRNRPSEPSSTADQISSSSKSQREADSAPKCGVDLVRSNLSDDLSDLGLDRNSAIERASIQQDFDGSAQSDADVQAKVQAQVQRQQHLLQMQQQLLQRAPQVRQQMQQMQQIQQMQQMQQIPSHMRQLIQQQMQLQMLQRQQVQMQHQKQQQLIQAHMQQQQRRQLQLQQKQAQEANLVQEAAEHQALQRQQIDQQLARQLQSPSTPHQVSEDVPSTLQGTQPAPHPQRQAQPHRVAPQQSPAQQEQSALSTAPSDDSQAQPDPFEQSPPAESTQSETLTNSAGRMGADFPHVTSYGSFSQFSGGDADLMDEMINSLFTEQGAGGEFNKANLFSSLFGTASEAADTSMECDAMAPYASAPSVSLSNDGSFTGRRQTGGASMASNPCSTTTRSELSAFSEGQSSSPPSSLGSSENADYLGLTNDLLRDSPPGSRPATD